MVKFTLMQKILFKKLEQQKIRNRKEGTIIWKPELTINGFGFENLKSKMGDSRFKTTKKTV